MPFPPERDHKITRETAEALIRRFREHAPKGAKFGSMFPRSVFEALLAQPRCAGIRTYYAKTGDGAEQTVLVPVDSDGNDMMDAQLFDMDFPCPPYCGGPG